MVQRLLPSIPASKQDVQPEALGRKLAKGAVGSSPCLASVLLWPQASDLTPWIFQFLTEKGESTNTYLVVKVKQCHGPKVLSTMVGT